MATISKEAAEEILKFVCYHHRLTELQEKLIAMMEPEVEAPKIMEDSRWHDAFKESDGREGI